MLGRVKIRYSHTEASSHQHRQEASERLYILAVVHELADKDASVFEERAKH